MLPSKWENLSCSTKFIHFLQKTITCAGLQAEQIFSVKIEKIYTFNFERSFWIFEAHSKNLSQIFKLLFHAGKINTFHLHGFLFSRSVQLKRTFSDVVVLFFIMWNCTDNANRDVLLTVENMYDIFSSIAICGCLRCLFSSSRSFGFCETFD